MDHIFGPDRRPTAAPPLTREPAPAPASRLRTRPILYVCAPFATRTPEEAALTDLAIRRALELGWCPIFAPYMLERFLKDGVPEERTVALECAAALPGCADGFLVVGSRVTAGMALEIQEWSQTGMPLREWPHLGAP